jgi:hypothetical protein
LEKIDAVDVETGESAPALKIRALPINYGETVCGEFYRTKKRNLS